MNEMTTLQSVLTISAVVLGTMATRFLPFLLYPENKMPPAYIRYLGGVLPFAMIGMLVVYCLKDVSLLVGSRGLPELLALVLLAGLHVWRKNMLLSVVGSTAAYMVLVQCVF